ncbi:MAG: GNAT family N-acetyltransferase [Pseudomonadota bacterium]
MKSLVRREDAEKKHIENEALEVETLEADRDWLLEAVPAYIEELAAFAPSYAKLAQGLKKNKTMLAFWFSRPEIEWRVFLHDGARVGFALLAKKPFWSVSQGMDFRMGEFFIAPECRRLGLGRAFAERTIESHPGWWEITQIPANSRAAAFWRQVVQELTKGDFTEEIRPDAIRQAFLSRG